MTFTESIVDGSSWTSENSASTSGISSDSPVQPTAEKSVGPGSPGTRSGPVVSKIRGPAARNTLAVSRGVVRMPATCSRVSSGAVVVLSAMIGAHPFGGSCVVIGGHRAGYPRAVQRPMPG